MVKYNLVSGNDLVVKLQEALGLEHTRRIILDIGMDSAVYVYAEFMADERIYEVDFSILGLSINEMKDKDNES